MTGLFELFAFSGISPFQSYLLGDDNADAPESFRSFSRGDEFLSSLPSALQLAKFPIVPRAAKAFDPRKTHGSRCYFGKSNLKGTVRLPMSLSGQSGSVRPALAFSIKVTNQVPHSHRNSIACRNAPFDRILSFLERMPRGVGLRAYGPT